MSRKCTHNWEEVQKFYDSGAAPMECCNRFGFDKATFWKATQRGAIKTDPSRARESIDPELDLAGLVFHDLTPISKFKSDNGRGIHWKCICSCGSATTASVSELISGSKKSCGCRRKKRDSEHHMWTGHEGISGQFFGSIKTSSSHRSKGRVIPFSITIEEAWDLYLGQNKKCAISGVDILLCPERRKRTASLDRIDSSKGYELGNVQWVHWMVNIMKSDFAQTDFLDMVRKIHTFQCAQ